MNSLLSQLELDEAAALVVERLIDLLQAGEVDVESFIAAHPEHAPTLRQLLPALRVLSDLSQSTAKLRATTPVDTTLRGALGDHRLVRQIGQGGMGVVYEAEQMSLARRVALKILPFASLWTETSLERFRNEVRIAAMLEHPNIVPIYGMGCERGVYFYAMKLIDGCSLSDVLGHRKLHVAEHSAESQTVDPKLGSADDTVVAVTTAVMGDDHWYRTAARLGQAAAKALAFAHEQGVIHRDIKPSNLLLDRQGKLFVADFGLARLETDVSLTRTGDLLGTPRYMSPEQASGSSKQLDPRTDIYSLGATLYELLTLRPVISGPSRAATIRELQDLQVAAPRTHDANIPLALEQIVLKCLQPDPSDRYATAGALAEDLGRYLAGQPVLARAPGIVRRTSRWIQRHPQTTLVMLTLLVLFSSISTVSFWLTHQDWFGTSAQRGPPGGEFVETDKLTTIPPNFQSPEESPDMLRTNPDNRKEQVTPSSRSLYRRGMVEKLEDRNLLASVPWNEVTDLSVPFGLSGAGTQWIGGEWRGCSVIDGDNLVVGVRNYDQVATDAGVAYVYQRNSNGTLGDVGDDKWQLTQTLFGNALTAQASDLKAGDFFGESAAIDGNWMFIAASHPTTIAAGPAFGDGYGVVYVYHHDNGAWQYSQKLVPSDRGGIDDSFGRFDKIEIEGNLAVIGASGDDNANGVDAGAVYLYELDGSTWVERTKLISFEAGSDFFGTAVELEGGQLVVSAAKADGVIADTGAIYIYNQNLSGQWQQTAKLLASDGQANSAFGERLGRYGNTIVVGAATADIAGADSGAAYVFEYLGGTWSQTTRLVSSDLGTGDNFGWDVAIHNDTILVGAPSANGVLSDKGAAYAFERVDGQWVEVDKLFESDRTSEGSGFGNRIDFANGGEAVINVAKSYMVNVYVYAQDATRITTAYQKTTAQTLTDRKGTKNGVTTSSINVGDAGTILDLDVRLDIAHTRVSDLSVSLKSPGGTQIPLFAQVGGSGDNFTTTILDSEAANPIGNGTAPFTGRYKPTGNLASLYGTNLAGTWQLIVTDSVANTRGTLLGWSIRVKYELPAAASSATLIIGSGATSLIDGTDTNTLSVSDLPTLPLPSPIVDNVFGQPNVSLGVLSTDRVATLRSSVEVIERVDETMSQLSNGLRATPIAVTKASSTPISSRLRSTEEQSIDLALADEQLNDSLFTIANELLESTLR